MTGVCPLQWMDIGASNGPALKDHAGTIVGDYLYVHGGQTARRDSISEAHHGIYRIQLTPTIGTWSDLTTADSPALSQHVCLSTGNRYLVFIGGWTGRTRIPGIHTFDTSTQKWLPAALNEPLLKGFPAGAGLSAHTATKMQSGHQGQGSFASLIIGREGSLRTQRKAGNIYLLYGDMRDRGHGDVKARYTYCEANSQLVTSSRSYHTSTAIAPNMLASVGGRKDHLIELLRWRTGSRENPSLDWPNSLVFPPDLSTLVTDVIKKVKGKKLNVLQAVIKNQSGWRGHSAVPGHGGIFISGGEGFNALVHDPLDVAYLYVHGDSDNSGTLYDLGKMKHARSYAVMAVNPNDNSAWIQGGSGPGNRVSNTLFRLTSVDQDNEITTL